VKPVKRGYLEQRRPLGRLNLALIALTLLCR